jgi:DNA-binding MarR family transcriptional regulator
MANTDHSTLKQGRARSAARSAIDFKSMRNEDFLSYKISVLSRVLDRDVDKRMLSTRGVSLTSLRILGHLHMHGEGRVFGVARKMHMLPSQISKSMVELVASGHVVKVHDVRDRRGTLFKITPKGREIIEEVISLALGKQREVAKLVGAKNYRILSECLDILIDHYGGQET